MASLLSRETVLERNNFFFLKTNKQKTTTKQKKPNMEYLSFLRCIGPNAVSKSNNRARAIFRYISTDSTVRAPLSLSLSLSNNLVSLADRSLAKKKKKKKKKSRQSTTSTPKSPAQKKKKKKKKGGGWGGGGGGGDETGSLPVAENSSRATSRDTCAKNHLHDHIRETLAPPPSPCKGRSCVCRSKLRPLHLAKADHVCVDLSSAPFTLQRQIMCV